MAIATRLAHGRIYYGWYIVGALFVSNFVSAGISHYAVAVYLKPMTEELGWSRGFFSTVVYGATLLSSPLSMLVWPLVDRKGARRIMLVSGVLLGVGTFALGLVHAKWQFVLIKSVIMSFGSVGVGPMIATLVVSNWFVRRRGRVLAFTSMGASTAGVAVTPVATLLLSAIGWRSSWMVLGATALVLNTTLVTLFMQRRPEDLGLLPDGDKEALQPGISKAPEHSEVSWTRREALGTSTFWVLASCVPLGLLGNAVMSQHLYSYLTDINFSPGTAAAVMMTVPALAVLAKPPWGLIIERVPPRYCFSAIFALMGLGLAVLVFSGSSLVGLFLGAALMGLGFSAAFPLQGLVWANYFGRGSQGKIRSLSTPLSALSGPLGPIMAGYVWDVTGSYRRIFSVYIATQAVAAVLILLARPPSKKVASAEALLTSSPGGR